MSVRSKNLRVGVRAFLHGLKVRAVRWALRDVPIQNARFGENSILISPGSVEVVRWDASQAPAQAGDIGMDIVSGRPAAFVGGSAEDLCTQAEAMLLDGSQAMTAALPMGNQRITGLSDAVAATDAVTLQQINSLVSPLADVGGDTRGYLGSASIAEINALSPASGDAVAAEDAGTPTAGTSDLLAAGDLAEFDGTSWKRIVANSGGFVPADTKAIVATGSTFVAGGGLTASTDEGKIVSWDGTAVQHTGELSPSDASLATIRGEGSVNENRTFVFDGAVPTGVWLQSGGVGASHSSLANLSADDHAQYALLTGRGSGQVLQGGQNANGNLTLESTSNATKGDLRIAAGTNVRMLGSDEITPSGDLQGSLGSATLRWNEVYTGFLRTGDLGLGRLDENGQPIAWRIREHHDGLRATNEVTGEEFEIPLRRRHSLRGLIARALGL